ncbi:DUF6715 family protein [[Clostridium] polysaccharolyticum]|uniref:Uncharacterized protein n=1 Tax=[Clostridium] polysaccharolyticum TaxID=29364 RepID=A0A1I0FC54_9FIRM|nr:DUF6715 family protein [[Clostridium] polysaccharolyticum]SET55730.1 hypothetical protein SAMN04487772_1306 [[Clostridium] polysaccharolyticum]
MADEKKHKQRINGKSIVLVILLFAVILGFYMSTSGGKKNEKKDDEFTILKEKNIEDSYPETPREVVKLYGRIVKCIYGKDMTSDKVEALVNQLRVLFDEELLEENPLEMQLQALDYDLKNFYENKEVIFNYEVNKNSLVTGKVDGIESATVELSFSLRKDKEYARSKELFLLRQDSDGKWKIVGWQLIKKEDKSKSAKEK